MPSFIIEVELLAYQGITEGEQKIIEDFVNKCKVVTLNKSIKKETIQVRKSYNTKLPGLDSNQRPIG